MPPRFQPSAPCTTSGWALRWIGLGISRKLELLTLLLLPLAQASAMPVEAPRSPWIGRTMAILTNRHEFTRLVFYDDVENGMRIAQERQAHPDRYPEGYFASGFIAASQSNTFFLQPVEMQTDGSWAPLTDSTIYGKSYDHYWMLSPPDLRLTSNEDGTAEGSSGVFKQSVVDAAVCSFRKALYLGMGELVGGDTPIATDWNRFETVTPLGGQVTGVVTENASVVRIDYRLAKHPTFEGWVEIDKISWTNSVFPSQVVNSSLRDGGRWGPFYGRYFAVDLGSTNFPRGSRGYVPTLFFDPSSFPSLGTNTLQTVIYRPDEIRVINRDGDRRVYPNDQIPTTGKSKSWMVAITIFAIANSAGLLWYAFQITRKKIKTSAIS
jgi:hypothetical protein